MNIPEMQSKITKRLLFLRYLCLKLLREILHIATDKTCHRQSVCQQTVLRFQIRQRQAFSNSIYLDFFEKYDNSGVVLI